MDEKLEMENLGENTGISRRNLLVGMGAAGLITAIPGAAEAGRLSLPRYKVAFKNVHTGEEFDGTYRIGRRYVPSAMKKIINVMRDFRTGERHRIDPQLIDIMASILVRSDQNQLEVFSGYRSPKTNAMLRRRSGGVAKNSYHMKGQAADLHLPNYSTRKLRNIALDISIGGVGYYPRSEFVHVDTGDVRSW